MIKLTDIKVNPNNPRLVKDNKFKKLCKSLQDFPQMMELRPIIVDENGIILGGNMRYQALKANGMKEIPDGWVKRADELTEEQKREFVIKDNVGFGEWDFEILANEWDEDKLIDWGLDIPVMAEDEELEAKEDDYEAPAGGIETDIALGDLFEIGEHRLLCGDSTDSDAVKRLMNEEKADLLITDLPYGVSYSKKNDFLNQFDKGNRNQKEIENDQLSPQKLYEFAKDVYSSIFLFIAKTSSYYAFMPQGGEQMMMMMMALKDSGFQVKHELIWVKNNHVLGRADYNYKHEPICYGWLIDGTHKFYSDFKTSILEFNKPNSSKEHPTMKPVELICELIANSSKDRNIILDPTAGSGSTMVAAHQLKRKCYGMELDPKYCQVIVDRMRKLDPTLVIKRNGEAWQQVN